MYIVTAIRDIDETTGVEIAGIFDSEDKAYKAKAKVESWMEENGFDNCEVFVNEMTVNRVNWYELEQDI